MTKLTQTEWKEIAMLKGRMMEAMANIVDLPILRESLVYLENQRGRAIGHALKARKENKPTRTDSYDPDTENLNAWS